MHHHLAPIGVRNRAANSGTSQGTLRPCEEGLCPRAATHIAPPASLSGPRNPVAIYLHIQDENLATDQNHRSNRRACWTVTCSP